MQVRLLGPVDVAAGDVTRPVPGLRRKAVLAALALHAGDVVSTDRLIDIVWGGSESAGLNTLQRHVSYLRGVLGDKATILSQPPGYRLDLGADPTDVVVAERLVEQARQCDDPARSAVGYRAALRRVAGADARSCVSASGLCAAVPSPSTLTCQDNFGVRVCGLRLCRCEARDARGRC